MCTFKQLAYARSRSIGVWGVGVGARQCAGVRGPTPSCGEMLHSYHSAVPDTRSPMFPPQKCQLK